MHYLCVCNHADGCEVQASETRGLMKIDLHRTLNWVLLSTDTLLASAKLSEGGGFICYFLNCFGLTLSSSLSELGSQGVKSLNSCRGSGVLNSDYPAFGVCIQGVLYARETDTLTWTRL
jgi:hypothetical protein